MPNARLARVEQSLRVTVREDFGEYLNELGLTGGAVEIGTFTGEFAEALLCVWEGRVLHVIDPWESYADYLSPLDLATHEPLEPQEAIFHARMKPYRSRVVVHKGHSPAMLENFTDASLDFGYIDGNHKRPYVEADLRALWPKIRNGGIIAGHDFESAGPWANDVRAAVLEFFGPLDLIVYWCPGNAHSWYVHKLEE